MKLYMKQKIFSFKDRFYIMDEVGNQRYYVEGEFPSFTKKLHIYDEEGNEVAFIRQKLFTFLPKFFVEVRGEDVAEIVKEFTFFKPQYFVKGLGWEVRGSFWAHDYEIVFNNRVIISIHKVWMSWGDSYEMDIADSEDETVALAVVLAIDAVMDASGN